MKYRIKEVVRESCSLYHPQVRLFGFWRTLEEGQLGIGSFECVEYSYEEALKHIKEHSKDYAKEVVVIHNVEV